MSTLRALLVAAVAVFALVTTGCTFPAPPTRSTPPAVSSAPPATQGTVQPGSDGWSFFVVRHADRADDGTDDPPLSQAGVERAQRLAGLMNGKPGVAVYATQFRRTQSTAQPTAAEWGVPITTYDPTMAASDLVDSIQSAHRGGAILIVGHSDKVPDIVGQLCECQVDPIDESDFGNLYEVDISAIGTVTKAQQTTGY